MAGASKPSRGKFITLEGVDGAGKSTHVPAIEGMLRQRGLDVLVTREPGGTPLAESLRSLLLSEPMDPVTETLLMFAARGDHVRRVLEPALAAGRWVVCDRFTDATRAYQGAGKGVPAALIEQFADSVHAGLAPDLTLVFDCPWEVASARLGGTGRALDRFEREDRDFFERVRAAYLVLARKEPRRVRILDATRSLHLIQKQVEEQIATI